MNQHTERVQFLTASDRCGHRFYLLKRHAALLPVRREQKILRLCESHKRVTGNSLRRRNDTFQFPQFLIHMLFLILGNLPRQKCIPVFF